MSLLLDALKKAEQAKSDSSLSLEPLPLDNRPSKPLLTPAMAGIAPGPALGSAARRAEQEAARMMFAAKQPALQNRPLWLLLSGLSVLAVAGGIFWFWYLLTYPPSKPPMTPAAPAARSAPPSPITQPAATNTPIQPIAAAAIKPSANPEREISKPAIVSILPVTSRHTPAASPAAAPESRLKLSQTQTAGINPQLAAAYDALIHRDYAIAKQQYQLVIRDDPLNLDACLGLATIAASTDDPIAALAYYRKALEIDPKNPVAHAGLAAMQTNRNAAASESRLKAQIAIQPEAPAPYSALGHIYAGQKKWGDAQQMFFEAYRLEPANPDYAFNLAVSLDHLAQKKLAREYYGKALSLAASHPTDFTAADVTTRLRQLTP